MSDLCCFSTNYSTVYTSTHDCYVHYFLFFFFFQDSEIEESSNPNAPATPSMSDVDDGEEVVSFRTLLTSISMCNCSLMRIKFIG